MSNHRKPIVNYYGEDIMLALSVPTDWLLYIVADFTHIFTFYSVHTQSDQQFTKYNSTEDDTFSTDSLPPLDVNTVH